MTAIVYKAGGVKGALLQLLHFYRRINLILLSIRGETPDSVSEKRVVSGTAWDEYCDALKAAGAALVSGGCPVDPFNQAEGYRYLSRVARAGLENFVESADRQQPRFVSIVDGLRVAPCKLGSDNPDNLYQNATIDGRRTYRVTGNRGTVDHLGFGAQAGAYGQPGGLRTVSYLELSDITIDANGRFDLIVGPVRPADESADWLETDPSVTGGDGLIIVRQTFGNRANEIAATLEITCIDGPSGPSPFTCAMLDAGLSSASTLVTAAPLMFARWAKGFQSHMNELPLFDQETSNMAGGDPNIRYYHSYWRLASDEALIIEGVPPPCATWNFQLNNHWMESLDYRYHRIHVNKHTAKYNDDGSVRIIVCASDPGLRNITYNHIETTGHNCGTMCFRWIKPHVDDSMILHPTTRVVKLSDFKVSAW